MNENVNAFQRHFVSDVRRCEEMLRRIRYFESELAKTTLVVDSEPDLDCTVPNRTQMTVLEVLFFFLIC